MTLPHWRDPDLEQLREVASRIVVLAKADTDQRTTLTRFTEATEHRDALVELLIDYSSRWFSQHKGQSVLVGPELYWLLTEPDGDEARTTAGRGAAKRARGMLLMCLLENISRQERPLGVVAEAPRPSEPAHRQRKGPAHVLNTTVVTA